MWNLEFVAVDRPAAVNQNVQVDRSRLPALRAVSTGTALDRKTGCQEVDRRQRRLQLRHRVEVCRLPLRRVQRVRVGFVDGRNPDYVKVGVRRERVQGRLQVFEAVTQI